jgi:branched-chain amino acid transport system substrate-binding protein
MLKRTMRFIVLLLLLSWAAPLNSAAINEIVIGVATSLTFLEGSESFQAVQLAVEEINSRGGVQLQNRRVPLRVASIDLGGASPTVLVADAIEQLENFITTQNIHALVVGPFRSEVMLASMDLIAHYKVPTLCTLAMSPALDAKIMRDPRYRYIFRTSLNSRYLVEYLIGTMKFLNHQFGFNKVHIIIQDVAWTRTAASLMIKLFFDRAGWEVVGIDVYPSGAKDFKESLLKAHANGAQILLPIFDSPQSGILVEQWNTMQAPVLLCGFISPMVGPGAWETFKGNIGGALNVILELGNIPSPHYLPAKTFCDAFRAKYGREIQAGHGPAPAYESVYILADAIEKADSLDPELLVPVIENTDRRGAMGRIRFQKGHQAIFGDNPREEALACIIQWENTGQRKIIYPPSIAQGDVNLPAFIKK